jgi:LPS O-antigen subunit length determinant protein (WzzB/FepE family)
MKKNKSYLADDEIDLADLIKSLWREKILILSISVICGLLGYLYASFKPEEFKSEITLKNPPFQLFENYSGLIEINSTNNNNNNNNNNITAGQFISEFKLKLLSLDNLESFVEESRNLDNFKAYLKSKNITVKNYFNGKFGEVKEKNIIILKQQQQQQHKYFLVFLKGLDGDIFLNNYVEFTKKKNITEFKKNLNITIENRVASYEQALETAKLINLENPILKSLNSQAQVVNEPEALFYKGSKVLSQNIIYFKRLIQRLENDQFNYNPILDKGITLKINTNSLYFYFATGLFIGFFLSFIIIFFKSALKSK